MMKVLSLILASIALASYPSSSAIEEPSTPAPLLQVSLSSKHGDVFAFDLFREMASTQQGNVTLSPASLERLLLLLREGAAGDTHSSLDKLLLGKQGVPSAIQVQSADALFVDQGFSLKPVSVPVHHVSFAQSPGQAVKAINDWASKKTHGMIPGIVTDKSITTNTRLVALNAIYLREKWLCPFEPNVTQKAPFHCADGTTCTVPMMLQQTEFRYAEGEDWQAVAFGYDAQGRKGEAGFFIGILPKASAHDFTQTLTVQKYNAIRQALAQAKHHKVLVFLPKMDLDSGIVSLKAPLKKLGLSTMFSDRADFRRFSDKPLMVSAVVQRCRVITNEKETIAAAVTSAIVEERCIPLEEIKEIHFDRPFIWLIGDLNTPAPPYCIGLNGKP